MGVCHWGRDECGYTSLTAVVFSHPLESQTHFSPHFTSEICVNSNRLDDSSFDSELNESTGRTARFDDIIDL